MSGYTITVLLPKFDNDGRLNNTKQIVDAIADRFGGATVSDATGLWLNREGGVFSDEHLRVEVDTANKANAEWVREQSRIWCQLLRQECLFVRVQKSETYFISGEA